jgi:hypothetical protein
MNPTLLVLACGALSHELVALQRRNGWSHWQIRCLPAELHNTPKEIPGAVRDALTRWQGEYEQVFVAYADCGSGGLLDPVLEEFGVERLPGAHCYSFFAGEAEFERLADEEPGTFYLTDFLARHFDRLVTRGLGLDRHPQLRDEYFRNYRRLVFLDQAGDAALLAQARAQAAFLGLEFHHRRTGLGPLELVLKERMATWPS